MLSHPHTTHTGTRKLLQICLHVPQVRSLSDLVALPRANATVILGTIPNSGALKEAQDDG